MLGQGWTFLNKFESIYLQKMILSESKMVHEMGQVLTGFDDFGVVEKP